MAKRFKATITIEYDEDVAVKKGEETILFTLQNALENNDLDFTIDPDGENPIDRKAAYLDVTAIGGRS